MHSPEKNGSHPFHIGTPTGVQCSTTRSMMYETVINVDWRNESGLNYYAIHLLLLPLVVFTWMYFFRRPCETFHAYRTKHRLGFGGRELRITTREHVR